MNLSCIKLPGFFFGYDFWTTYEKVNSQSHSEWYQDFKATEIWCSLQTTISFQNRGFIFKAEASAEALRSIGLSI